MRKYLIYLTISIWCTSLQADNVNALEKLKTHLDKRIEVVSDNEIHFCPDNTCSIYISTNHSKHLPNYLYLKLYHESEYISVYEYLQKKSIFRSKAVEEPEIRGQVVEYCNEKNKTPECILKGLRNTLKVKECFGRYDEGYFCRKCPGEENECKKL
ncbi:MAG: hypothetical protein GY941_04450 [Planctomycetes bacterium]|nr:hypothetical protein [Planctomycetota bacterium]